MNLADSERIAAILERQGYKAATEKEADLIVVNACSVRQKAVDRIWGKIKKWQEAGKKIILTGCVLPLDRKKFARKGIEYTDFRNENFFNIIPRNLSPITYIPIMTGCDNFCSYCAVPYTRGREVSRPLSDIMREIKIAVAGGNKEILLLGQNVNSYKIKKSKYKIQNDKSKCKIDNSDFIELLKKIDNLPGDFKLNFLSSNPHDMSNELIECLADLKKWPRELHLAMQSGDDEILKKMNRRYNSSQYLALISKLKTQISKLRLSTDIIVGFPGETKTQFNNTVKICKKINFDKAYIAQYSPRPGTAAAKLKDDVSPAEKKRRWKILENLINK